MFEFWFQKVSKFSMRIVKSSLKNPRKIHHVIDNFGILHTFVLGYEEDGIYGPSGYPVDAEIKLQFRYF